MTDNRFTGHIRLENLFCRRASFEQVAIPTEASAEIERLETPEEYNIGVSLKATERGPNRSDVELSVTIEPDEENGQPYAVTVSYLGQFRFKDLPEKLSQEDFMARNAAAIMFPFVREAIGNLTNRGAYGPLWLPPINVVAMLDRAKDDTAEGDSQESTAHRKG